MNRYVILKREAAAPAGTRGPGVELFRTGKGPSTLSVESVPDHAVAELNADPHVEAAPTMPTRLIQPLASEHAELSANWGVAAVKADQSRYTGMGVTVAVLDTGIDKTHPAFAGVGLIEKDFSGHGDGDRLGHGTHCSGIIFGRDIDGQRIGVARGVERALIGKVLGDDGAGQSSMVFEALTWAMHEKADIISMSLGFDFPGMVVKLTSEGWPVDLATSTALEAYRGNLRMFDAIMAVLKAQSAFGVSPLVVAAAGNESRREMNREYRIAASLPAAADNVVSVAAVGRAGENYTVANFSNIFASVAAPGMDIASAWPGGGLRTLSGTSMACPHVAGVAALWWEALRGAKRKPSAKNVTARLLAKARSDVFVKDIDEADVGQGIVTSPLTGVR
ncbi:MAG: peptidase [Herbaspirillum sp.]|jgi:subtilisin family serine protease|nr:peptidase [Herbaspirillum sp.]